MKDIQITTYRGLGVVGGETSLRTIAHEICTGKHAALAAEITALVAAGNIDEADRRKKELPFYTLTGNYHDRRHPCCLLRYNPVITIDIDKLKEYQMEPLRHLIASDPDVVFSFVTPKRHGFKIFVYLRTPYACKLREATFAVLEITYRELEAYHALMYEACRAHIATLLGVAVDTSGKDIPRGFFAAHDPQAYLNTALLEEIPPLTTRIVLPDTPVKKPGRKPQIRPAAPPQPEASGIKPWEHIEYRKALASTRRSERFEPGNRDVFLFALGNRCYKKGIALASAQQLARQDFGTEHEDIATPIANAYQYTDRTDRSAKQKQEKTPVITQVLEYLSAHYDIRRNTIFERIEFTDYAQTDPKRKGVYRPLRNKDYNSIFVNLQIAGIPCFQNYLRAVIDSNYAHDFNPFATFFYGLRPWDGVTDYIGRLADTVKARDQEFWRESFRRWLVGLVACALYDEALNQLVLILYSEQGKGKSSWLRRLLPPALSEYYHNGMIDPANKDDLMLLSTRLLINMEEFEGVRQGDVASLKRITGQDIVTQRRVYDIQAEQYVRRASFAASTNNRQCMQDLSGNRRFLLSELAEIDYRTPVDHEGVYSQALALLHSGFQYWYEGEEISSLNRRNERHRMKEPVEENLYVYYRPATEKDYEVKWKPAAVLMGTLCIYGRLQGNRQTLQLLVQVLERDGFQRRMNNFGITEYAVVEYSPEDIDKNYRQRTDQGTKAVQEQELPF